MAIQPIDLQAVFTQVDKVGKSIANQREGLAIAQALHNSEEQRKREEQVQSVNQVQDMGEGVERVKDRGAKKSPQDEQSKNGSTAEGETEDDAPLSTDPYTIQDPSLGMHIDLSG
ncbi:hypothetical protein FACS1894200_02090 [Spirochaetia bacterium]|nr:hypothetical protein FACS1894200_02090 [Spirochaetia bacterium]